MRGVRGHSLADGGVSRRVLERLREGAPLYTYALVLVAKISLAIALAAPAMALVRRMMGENIDLVGSVLNSLKFALVLALMGLSATAASAVVGHFTWKHERVRPWTMGLAASAGLWGALVLIAPNGIESRRDIYAFVVVWSIFGVLLGYFIYRWQQRVRENAP